MAAHDFQLVHRGQVPVKVKCRLKYFEFVGCNVFSLQFIGKRKYGYLLDVGWKRNSKWIIFIVQHVLRLIVLFLIVKTLPNNVQ